MANKTVTVRPSGGDYTSLQAAITGEVGANANLVTNEMILTISIEGTWSSDDTSSCQVIGFTVSSDYYVKIIDNSGGSYRLAVASGRALIIRSYYTEVHGISLHSGDTTSEVVNPNGRYILLEGLKITGGRDGIRFVTNTNNPYYAVNCIIYGYTRYGILGSQDPHTAYIYNVTCVGGTHGLYADYGETYNVKNSYFGGSSTADLYNTGSGTINLTTTFTEDGTLSTSTADYSTDNFTNVTAGSEDLSLPSGSGLIDQGTDLSSDATYPFDYDIDGTTRSGTWDVGAYEYSSGGGGDTLTSLSVITGDPVLASPSIGQEHVITGTSIITGAPVLDTPSISQAIAMAAVGIVTGDPVIGSTALTQAQSLDAVSIITGDPTLGQAAISQEHALSAAGIVTGDPVLSQPLLSTEGMHALSPESMVTGDPVLGLPDLLQVHSLDALGIITGDPLLGNPILVEIPAGSLLPESIITGSPELDTPLIKQVHHLLPESILTGDPILGRPVLDAVLISGVVYVTIADYKIPGMDLSYKIPDIDTSYLQPSIELSYK